MKVILLTDVRGLGPAGAVKEVKAGYARNYLLPQGLAVEASEGNVRALGAERRAAADRSQREQHDIASLAAALQQAVVELRAKGGEGGRLFGSVTAQDIAGALAARGFAVTKKQVELGEPIRTAGFYKIPIRVGPGVTAQIDLNVVVENA